jgi:hypothetical protein
VVSEFGYGPKHENELTVLVEHERAIQENEIEKRESLGRVIGGSVQDLAAAILVIGTGSLLASMSNQTTG